MADQYALYLASQDPLYLASQYALYLASQDPLYLASQDPLARQFISDAYTDDSIERLRELISDCVYETSPEDRQRLRQAWENPPAPKPNLTYYGGPYIPRRLYSYESLVSASFLTKSEGFAELPNVLISRDYKRSYIPAEVLKSLGHDFVPANVHVSMNPKGGGAFKPIGYCTLVRKGLGLPPQHES